MSNQIAFQTYSTFTSKEKRIETVSEMPNGRQLSLVTHRDFNGFLVTRASVGTHDGHFIKFLMGRDYSRICERSKVRMTKGNVEAQHNKYLADISNIADDAAKYYGVSIVQVGA
jgi:hypothetical protein